jgi:hypothetical protein
MELTPIGARNAFTNRLAQMKFTDLGQFFSAFFKIVEENDKMGRDAIAYKSRILQGQESRSHASPQEKPPLRKEHRPGWGERPSHARKSINFLEEEEPRDDWEEGEFEYFNELAEEEESLNAAEGSYTRKKPNEPAWNQRNQAAENQKGLKRSDELCQKYLIEGRCNHDSCSAVHGWKKLQEERRRLIHAWGGEVGQKFDFLKSETPKAEPPWTRGGNRRQPAGPPPSRHLKVLESERQESESEAGEDLNLVASLMQTGAGSGSWRASHRMARMETTDGVKFQHPVTVLFDSGASGHNYISDKLIQKAGLETAIEDFEGSCRVANGEIVKIQGVVQLSLYFDMEDGRRGPGQVCRFQVLKGLREELILGIRDILLKFKTLFLEMISETTQLDHISALGTDPPPLLEPWSTPGESVPEEELIPEPSIPINFLEVPPDEAFRQYLSELPGKVDPAFAEATEVMAYLRGEGADPFNPVAWEGINMEPVEFEFEASMPAEIKPYRSRTPHGLEEVFEREMLRLSKYLTSLRAARLHHQW